MSEDYKMCYTNYRKSILCFLQDKKTKFSALFYASRIRSLNDPIRFSLMIGILGVGKLGKDISNRNHSYYTSDGQIYSEWNKLVFGDTTEKTKYDESIETMKNYLDEHLSLLDNHRICEFKDFVSYVDCLYTSEQIIRKNFMSAMYMDNSSCLNNII